MSDGFVWLVDRGRLMGDPILSDPILFLFVGSSMVLLIFFYIFYTGSWLLILLLPLVGYGFAWLGHFFFFFEKNSPATFKYPFYSLIGDWVMFKDMLIGNIRF